MKLWHAVWFWQTIHCEAIQEVLVTTTQINSKNGTFQSIMSGG